MYYFRLHIHTCAKAISLSLPASLAARLGRLHSSRDRTQLPLHGPVPHFVGLLVQLKLYIAHVQDQAKPVSPAPEVPITSSALCSTPTYMSTHVCAHIKAKYF